MLECMVTVTANAKCFWMMDHASESFFDLLDQGSEADSNSESSDDNNHPSRERHVV